MTLAIVFVSFTITLLLGVIVGYRWGVIDERARNRYRLARRLDQEARRLA